MALNLINGTTWASYGPQQIELKKISEREINSDVYTGVIQDKATRDNSGFNNYAGQGEPDVRYKYENGNDGIGYFYIENNSKATTANITIDFVSLQNMELQAPYKGQKKPTLIVAPNSFEVLHYLINDTPCSVSFRMMAQFKKNSSA